jgi:hypothetical protein
MKKKPFSLKTKVCVCVLMFSFLLFPITPNIALSADDAVTENIAGAKVAQAETGTGAGEAAAGVAATGASTGLSGAAIAAIAVGVAAATVAIIAVSTGDGDDAVAPTAHH